MPGTLEFAIHTLVETRPETSGFEQKYRNDETGRTAYDPQIVLAAAKARYPWLCREMEFLAAVAMVFAVLEGLIFTRFCTS